MNRADQVDRKRSGGTELRIKPSRPEDVDTSRGKRSANQRPVRLNETQHPEDRHFRPDNSTDDADLLHDAIDDLRAVAGSDHELLDARAHHPALDLQGGTSLVALCIDHEDSGAGDDEVVDVGAATRDSPIVKYTLRVRREFRQASAEALLPDSPNAPRPGRLWVAAEREDQTAQLRMRCSYACRALQGATLEFAARGSTWPSHISR